MDLRKRLKLNLGLADRRRVVALASHVRFEDFVQVQINDSILDPFRRQCPLNNFRTLDGHDHPFAITALVENPQLMTNALQGRAIQDNLLHLPPKRF